MFHHRMMHNHSSMSGPILGAHLLMGMLIIAVALSVGILLRRSMEGWVAQNYGGQYASPAGWLVLIVVVGVALLLAAHLMRG